MNDKSQIISRYYIVPGGGGGGGGDSAQFQLAIQGWATDIGHIFSNLGIMMSGEFACCHKNCSHFGIMVDQNLPIVAKFWHFHIEMGCKTLYEMVESWVYLKISAAHSSPILALENSPPPPTPGHWAKLLEKKTSKKTSLKNLKCQQF